MASKTSALSLKIEELEGKIFEAQSEFNTLNSTIVVANEERAVLYDEIKRLKNSIAIEKGTFDEYIEKKKSEIEVLKGTYSALGDKYKNLFDAVEQLKQVYLDWHESVAIKTRESLQLSESIASLTSEKITFTAERDVLIANVAELQNRQGNLVAEIADIETQTNEKKKEYEASVAALTGIADKRDELNQREAYLKEQYQRIGINW